VIFRQLSPPRPSVVDALSAPAGLERLFSPDNGSTAVEVDLQDRGSRWRNQGSPRRQADRFEGLHGDTFGAMALGERSAVSTAPFEPCLPSPGPWPASWWRRTKRWRPRNRGPGPDWQEVAGGTHRCGDPRPLCRGQWHERWSARVSAGDAGGVPPGWALLITVR